MSYILDFNKVQPGDIVISSGTSLGAQVIKLGTWSKDTHAMLYVGHTMIHAVPDGGVFSKNPQRELFKSAKHVKVLRLKESVASSVLSSICDYARSLSGSIYSVKEAIRTKRHSNKQTDAQTNMQFCSRLVAQSYAYQDINLVKNSNYCSPKELSNSDLLEEVLGAVRKASADEVEFSKTPDPTIENQKVTYKWLNKVRVIASALDYEVQTINDVADFVKSHPEKDPEISELIKLSGYLEHYQCDLKLNPYRYDLEGFKEYFSNRNIPIEEAVEGELQKEPSMIDHFYRNLTVHVQLYKETGLEYHDLHRNLYLNMLQFIKDRLVVMYSSLTPPTDMQLKAKVFIFIQRIDEIVI
ncbi:YiiX/YebB-like N1pC/P60 family cysteine hydrolase [Shewanella marisflavi]|uniref:YiiX/YebB-like N1pC/P60 family cysteine hydrolase n=1 Tax=Shewanella marisflavi TaxID=260364 RepID=UPI003AAFA940